MTKIQDLYICIANLTQNNKYITNHISSFLFYDQTDADTIRQTKFNKRKNNTIIQKIRRSVASTDDFLSTYISFDFHSKWTHVEDVYDYRDEAIQNAIPIYSNIHSLVCLFCNQCGKYKLSHASSSSYAATLRKSHIYCSC